MKYRNLIFVTVMSIITLGIYDIYWMFSTRNELVKKKQYVPSPWIIFAPLLALLAVALLQMFIAFFLSQDPVGGDTNSMTGLNILSIVIGLVGVLAIIPLAIYWTWKYSQAVAAVTKGALGADISFVIALVTNIIGFWFIWPIVVQSYFNKLTSKPR